MLLNTLLATACINYMCETTTRAFFLQVEITQNIQYMEDLFKNKLKNTAKEIPGYRYYVIPYALYNKEVRFRSHSTFLADQFEVRYNYKDEKRIDINLGWRW